MSAIRDTRPLTARSVIASTLLGVDPPRLPALALVRSGELFGLSEGATRTALSRMAASGEVVPEDGHYSLTGPLLDRHARQQAARHTEQRRWDRTWVAAIVTADRRAASDRAAFRSAARQLKLAELREGVWVRPDDLPAGRNSGARAVVDGQATWWTGIRPTDAESLLAAFPITEWADRAHELIERMGETQPLLDRWDTEALGDTFVIAAAVLRHLVSDPDLPTELLPADWPGEELRSVFDRFDHAFKQTWRSWFRSFRDG